MKLSIFIFLKSGAMIFPGRFSINICQEFWYKIPLLKLIYSSKLVKYGYDCIFHMRSYKASAASRKKCIRCGSRETWSMIAKRKRRARVRSSGKTRERRTRGAPLTNLWPASQASSTTPLANLWLESQTNLITLLTHLWKCVKAYQRMVYGHFAWNSVCPKPLRPNRKTIHLNKKSFRLDSKSIRPVYSMKI